MLDASQSIRFVFTIPALILIAVGLIGLYGRLRVGGGNGSAISLGAALFGLILVIARAVGGLVGIESNSDVLRAFLGLGMVLFVLGLAGLSIASFSKKALGVLQFRWWPLP